MKYLSTFSGIEAATVAWHPLGWEPVGFSEIEPFPSAVLKHHYPQVQNYGDITQFGSWSVEPFRLLVGGSPCQSFSVAGLRKGLADERGNLMLEFGRLAQHYRPTWVVWENVPGVLSSNGGRDFGTFLGMLAEFGYGFAYRVLDAQYFGVAQRRRRVFVVAHLGDWRPAAAVLFDPHCMSGHPAPSREKGKGTSGGFADGTPTTCPTIGTELAKQVNNQMVGNAEAFYHAHAVPHAFKLRGGCEGGGKGYLGQDECAFTLSTHQDQHLAQPISIQGNLVGREKGGPHGVGVNEDGTMYTLTKADVHAVAFQQNTRDEVRLMGGDGQIAGALAAEAGMKQQNYIASPVTYDMAQVTAPVNKQNRKPGDPCHTLAKENAGRAAVVQPMAYDRYNDSLHEIAPTVRAANTGRVDGVVQPMAFDWQSGGDSRGLDPKHTAQLQRCQVPAVMTQYAVRRLTPVEAERLQGFPDNYTAIPWKNKPADQCPDGPRYKALGNSMAVPVMRWIGERIEAVEELMKEIKQ